MEVSEISGNGTFQALPAAAAKSLQSCPTLCDPTDGSPPGSPIPGILQARGGLPFPSPMHDWKVKVKSLSHVRLLATPGTAAYQAPPSMGFSRQEYWSGVPLPSPDLLNYKLWVNVHNLNFNKPSRYSWVKALKDSPKYLFLLYGKGTFTRVTTHMGKGHTRFSGTQTLSRCYSLGISKMLLLFSTNLSEGFLGIRRFKKL